MIDLGTNVRYNWAYNAPYSYEFEDKRFSSPAELVEFLIGERKEARSAQTRIQELEEEIEGYKDKIEMLYVEIEDLHDVEAGW